MNYLRYWGALLCFSLILLPSCIIDLDDDDDDFYGNCIDGDGPIVSEVLNLPNFRGIQLSVEANVVLRQGSFQEIIVEGKSNVVREIERDLESGIWDIEFDRCVRDVDELNIFITTPVIDYIGLTGSGEIFGENVLLVDDIELRISGSGDIDLALEADDIEADLAGSGRLFLEGVADEIELDITGSGDVRAFNLTVNRADIDILGSGDVEITVLEELDVDIEGSGDVYYRGNPSLDIDISGNGRVIDAN